MSSLQATPQALREKRKTSDNLDELSVKAPRRSSPLETQWHFYYSDPKGDVVLQSNDSVCFKADSWRLAKAR